MPVQSTPEAFAYQATVACGAENVALFKVATHHHMKPAIAQSRGVCVHLRQANAKCTQNLSETCQCFARAPA